MEFSDQPPKQPPSFLHLCGIAEEIWTVTRERLLVPTRWRQQEHRRSESEMDIDLSGLCEKILYSDSKSDSKFWKEDTQTGQFEAWHGRKEISWTKCVMYLFVLYLCCFCIYYLSLPWLLTVLEICFIAVPLSPCFSTVFLLSKLGFKWAMNQYLLTCLAVVLC